MLAFYGRPATMLLTGWRYLFLISFFQKPNHAQSPHALDGDPIL